MNRPLVCVVICLAVFAAVFVSERGFGQDGRRQDLERQLAELRRQKEQIVQEQRQALTKQLGDRLPTLMNFSVEELRFALELKMKEAFDGAAVLSAEDEPQFLGKITDSLDPESIFNDIGTYGSTIGAKSIWNSIGRYGSTIANTSAFNTIASRPPLIVKDNKIIGRLTVNRTLSGAVDPALMKMVFAW